MLAFEGLNWIAIFVATLAGFVLGGLWYGPLFGMAWMAALGLKPEDVKPTATPFIVSFLTAFITAVILAGLLNTVGMSGLANGLLIGGFVGIGFIATAMASDNAFCGWGVRLWLIQAGYRVTYSILMGGILAVWPPS